jgi:adenosylmethionine-8-amino-7-oxononanoate aminotransferase
MSNQIFSYTNHSKFDDPEIFVSGNNDLVTNINGKNYVDCNSGLWNVNFGYNNPNYKIEMPDLHFYPTHFWSSTEPTELAAKQICDWFDYDKVFFGHSGSDAIDTAIYISKYVNNKSKILAYKYGYHGSSFQAQICDSYNALVESIDDSTGAVIIEPLMITHGIIEFDNSILLDIFKLKEKYNFNIIFDETVTALGRADYSFEWKPDILIASKGLTNGLVPLSAVLVNEQIGNFIKNTDKVFSHGYTMSGYPIACKALSKTIELVRNNNNQILQNQFKKNIEKYSLNYYNKGLVFGISVTDGIYARRQLQKQGYLIRQHNNILLLMPMFVAEINHYERLFEVIATF